MSDKKNPTRQTFAEIDLPAIAYNIKAIRRLVGPKTKIMAIVKANAYGHGIAEVSKFIQKGYADAFGVAFPEEGKVLRESGIKKTIQVFTLPAKEQIPLFLDYDLEPTISSLHEAKLLDGAAGRRRKSLQCHIKIDTGMNRIGVRVHELSQFLSKIRTLRRIEIRGVCTHFATAEWSDRNFRNTQFAEFQLAMEILRKHGVEYDLAHCANSASTIDAPETHLDMVRPGLCMYGIYPSPHLAEKVILKPALRLRTTISMVKWIDKGESVSYGRKFIAEEKTQIATLPIGYADGYPRILSGKASVLLRGGLYPIVGNICMDQFMIDAGTKPIVVGDEVVLVGEQRGTRIGFSDLAQLAGTISYELMCGLANRIPRVYKKK